MTRTIITPSVHRSGSHMSNMERYLKNFAKMTPSSAAELLIQFASGARFVCPVLSASLPEGEQWDGHRVRAALIAEYGLFASNEDANKAQKAADAPLIAERRKALSDSFLDIGAEARADALAADLSITVAQAKATLKSEQPKSTIPTIAQRAEGAPDMGGADDMGDAFSGSAKSQSSKMSAAIDRAAGIEKGNLK